MATIPLEPRKLGIRLRSDADGSPKAIVRAIVSGSHRMRSWIVKETPVDRGILRVAWKVMKLSDGAELVNDQPYAGVMELGARPFKISKEGMEALQGWVFRKILNGTIALSRAGKVNTTMLWKVNATVKSIEHAQHRAASHRARVRGELEEEAKRIAWAIAKKFEKVGIKGQKFVWKNLDKLTDLMSSEIERYLIKFFNRGASEK